MKTTTKFFAQITALKRHGGRVQSVLLVLDNSNTWNNVGQTIGNAATQHEVYLTTMSVDDEIRPT